MDTTLLMFLIVGFVAVVLALQGAYLLWHEHHSPEVQRFVRRLQSLSTSNQGRDMPELLKRRHAQQGSALHMLLMSLPRVARLDQMIEQAGMQFGVLRLLLAILGCGTAGLLLSLLLRAPLPALMVFTALGAGAPLLWLSSRRAKRLAQIESQLPDVIDLLSRALRAGHSFGSALQMAAEESPQPIAAEFRIVNDEINFGVAHVEALRNLTVRVPSNDLRFFVIAVLLQRETGGNLAEVLANIATLIRNRLRLFGKVRVLAAEGKLSGWILGLLPIGTGALLYTTNPDYVSLLWRDPTGLYISFICVALLAIGALWMRRIVRIRV